MKPTLDLYIGRKVVAVTRKPDGEEWEWGIKLQGDVEIRNKDRRETFRPMKIVNYRLSSISLSPRDTTIHFTKGNTKITASFNPTQYVIFDPKYGGEVFPQWPEELDEMGIHSHPEEGASSEPSEEWPEEERKLVAESDARRESDRVEFLKDTEAADESAD